MKIYKNLWAGYDCYFVKIGSAWSSKNEPAKTKVLLVKNWQNKWDIDFGTFYSRDLKDTEHFPIVGEIDLKKEVINLFLSRVSGGM